MQFTKSGQEQTPVPRDFPNLLLWLSTEKTFPTGKFKSHSWVKPSYSEVSGRRGPLIQMCVPQPSMISPAMLTLYEIKVLLSVCFRQKFASLPLCKHCMQTRQVQKHLLLFYFFFSFWSWILVQRCWGAQWQTEFYFIRLWWSSQAFSE